MNEPVLIARDGDSLWVARNEADADLTLCEACHEAIEYDEFSPNYAVILTSHAGCVQCTHALVEAGAHRDCIEFDELPDGEEAIIDAMIVMRGL